jgi:hypothetical protein
MKLTRRLDISIFEVSFYFCKEGWHDEVEPV